MTLEEMKARKKELGYSSREIAELSGLPFGTVQKIFGGKTSSPRHATIEALEKVLGEEKDNSGPARRAMQAPVHAETETDSAARNAGTLSEKDIVKRRQSGDRDIQSVGMVREPGTAYDDGSAAYDGNRLGEIRNHRPWTYSERDDYTIEDWENLPDEVHAELIRGRLYFMATPLTVHQELVMILSADLRNYILSNKGPCRVFPAPTGFQLFLDDRTMVEPDIAVVCDRDRIGRKWVKGVPDLAIEILSPSNRKHDLIEKLQLYQEAGVQEYWIVDPDKMRIMVYYFPDSDVLHIYTFDHKVPVRIWDGKCVIDFAEIREEISYLYDKQQR